MNKPIDSWTLAEEWVAVRLAPFSRAVQALGAGGRVVPLGDNGDLLRELGAQLDERAQHARRVLGDWG